jgi:hypothetical protein
VKSKTDEEVLAVLLVRLAVSAPRGKQQQKIKKEKEKGGNEWSA